jgi:hypothetical protein
LPDNQNYLSNLFLHSKINRTLKKGALISASLALRETLIAGYGQPDETSDFVTKTIGWEGDDCSLTFSTDLMGDANAMFKSKSVTNKIKELKLKKAKEAAASGAGAL